MSSRKYLSTRGSSSNRSFEEVVLQGLAPDGGLYIPEVIPQIPGEWADDWLDWSFEELAYKILTLYIDSKEIPEDDLRRIVNCSYSTFDTPEITPLITLDQGSQLHLLELFHGPTFAFKDVALQFLGNLFEYFLVRQNEDKTGQHRQHLTVIGATSGDTGSAAIYGLRSKKDVSVFITFPHGRVSPMQEAQMTAVLDANVHNVAVEGATFDDCQDFVKALFGDQDINSTHKLGAVNSINWARILAQITYYFFAYSRLVKTCRAKPEDLRFVVPTGNFGDVLAGYFALRMGLPIGRLVVATNENDILDRFWKTGSYEKHPAPAPATNGTPPANGITPHVSRVRETHSPAMDILVSSNFERLLWLLAFETDADGTAEQRRERASTQVRQWQGDLKARGGFVVRPAIHAAAKEHFESERVSDPETLEAIARTFAATRATDLRTPGTRGLRGYVLDPHSAVGVTAAKRSMQRSGPPRTHTVCLATAHPAKFARAVELALRDEKEFEFEKLLPKALRELKDKERRVKRIPMADGLEALKKFIRMNVPTSG